MLQAEDERLPGESIEDGVIRVYKKLGKAVSKLKQESESMRGQIIQETIQGARENFPPIGGHPIPIISRDEGEPENTLELIQNAPDMRSLSSFKLIAGKNPELYKAYNLRLKELMK